MRLDSTSVRLAGGDQIMRLKTNSLLAIAAVLLATSALAGQAKPAAKPATPAPQAAAPAAAPLAPGKFVAPIRGDAEVQMTKPVTKRTKDAIVTTFSVKNMSTTNSIAGLKISEYWYDKTNNPVSGDEFRYRKPLMPQEVIQVTLSSPINEKMASSQYKFEQQNGAVKPKQVAKF
jgi:hypothetical protein